MNPIELLEAQIRREVPSAKMTVHRPRAATGSWWLDARNGEHALRVEWSPRRGFGVSASAPDDNTYGEGPDEVFTDPSAAAVRVMELLETKAHTAPNREVLLGDLRAMVGVTQEELAQRLGVQQAAVSRLERRGDITLSSLQRFVKALGAELEISVTTSTGERMLLFAPDPAKPIVNPLPRFLLETSRGQVETLRAKGQRDAALAVRDSVGIASRQCGLHAGVRRRARSLLGAFRNQSADGLASPFGQLRVELGLK